MTDTAPVRRGRTASRVLVLVVACALAWAVTVVRGSSAPDLLPDTAVEFSLDLRVLGTEDVGVVYIVEQRARPGYRIFAYDTATGSDETVFTVPEDAIIYGIDLDPSGSMLAVSYTTDFAVGGNGVWTLDLASGALTEVAPAVEGIFLTDLEWSADGASIMATRVDRTSDEEELEVVAVGLADGTMMLLADGAVNPAVDGGQVYYLDVDEEGSARRSVRTLDLTSGVDAPLASGEVDLDHLLASDGIVTVAALTTVTAEATLSLGAPAEAHGSHDVPSTWLDVTAGVPIEVDTTTVYDADLADGQLAYVTLEGLSVIIDGEKLDLIASRALRFVAA